MSAGGFGGSFDFGAEGFGTSDIGSSSSALSTYKPRVNTAFSTMDTSLGAKDATESPDLVKLRIRRDMNRLQWVVETLDPEVQKIIMRHKTRKGVDHGDAPVINGAAGGGHKVKKAVAEPSVQEKKMLESHIIQSSKTTIKPAESFGPLQTKKGVSGAKTVSSTSGSSNKSSSNKARHKTPPPAQRGGVSSPIIPGGGPKRRKKKQKDDNGTSALSEGNRKQQEDDIALAAQKAARKRAQLKKSRSTSNINTIQILKMPKISRPGTMSSLNCDLEEEDQEGGEFRSDDIEAILARTNEKELLKLFAKASKKGPNSTSLPPL